MDRKEFLRLAIGAATGVATGGLLESCSGGQREPTPSSNAPATNTVATTPTSVETRPPNQPTATTANAHPTTMGEATRSLYWQIDGAGSESDVAGFDPADMAKVTRVMLSFAGVDAQGQLTPGNITSGVVKMTKSKFAGANVGFAVGGAGSGLDPSIAQKPEVFAANLAKTATLLGVGAVALDFEFPKAAQKQAFVDLVGHSMEELRKIGITDLSVAIPPTRYNREGLDLDALAKLGITVENMTYDFHGTWENSIGHDGSQSETLASIDELLAKGIPASQILGGYGFYGRLYAGKGPNTPVSATDKDQDNAKTNRKLDAMIAQGGWKPLRQDQDDFMINEKTGQVASRLTEAMIRERNAKLASKGVGRMGWDIKDMTATDLQAFVS